MRYNKRVPNKARMLYIITDGEHYKLGYSSDPSSRLKDLQTANAKPLKLLAVTEGAYAEEAKYHKVLSHTRSHGEWFSLSHELMQVISSWEKLVPVENSFLQQFANDCVLSYLLKYAATAAQIDIMVVQYSQVLQDIPFILESTMHLASCYQLFHCKEVYKALKTMAQKVGSFHNLPGGNCYSLPVPLQTALQLGVNAEQVALGCSPAKLVELLSVDCYNNSAQKISFNYEELHNAFNKALTEYFPATRNIYQGVLSQLREYENLTVLVQFRQTQRAYELGLNKLKRGELLICEANDYGSF